jgi:hypothetical protein
MAAPAVMEDLQIFEDRIRQLDACLPPPPVEELGLRAAQKQLDGSVAACTLSRCRNGLLCWGERIDDVAVDLVGCQNALTVAELGSYVIVKRPSATR